MHSASLTCTWHYLQLVCSWCEVHLTDAEWSPSSTTKWAGPGAVGHHNTDSPIFQPCIRDRCSRELIYLLGLENLPYSAANISLSLVSDGSFSAFSGGRRHSDTVPAGPGTAQVLLTAKRLQVEVWNWTAPDMCLPSTEVANDANGPRANSRTVRRGHHGALE